MSDVVVSEFMHPDGVEHLREHFETLYDPDLAGDRDRLLGSLDGARALVVRNRTLVDEAVLAAAPRLRVVGRLGVGLDNIDVGACRARGVAVRPAIGANAAAVAEHVIGALLALSRPSLRSTDRVLAGEWPRTELVGRELGGKRLGLLGLGHTAQEVARRAQCLGMAVAGHDPVAAPPDGVEPMGLEQLFESSDAVSIHVPLTDATAGLVGDRLIELLPDRALLVDTSRGGVVDHDAVARALESGKLGGAALDVFTHEPPSPDQLERFRSLPNVILTPHLAGITEESDARIGAMIAAAVIEELEEQA